MTDKTIGVLERIRDAKLKKLARIGPVLQGTITTIGVKCGNPDCKCARGDKHVSNILTKKIGGKTKSVYIPLGILEEAKKWTQEFKKAKRLLKEISSINEKILKIYVKTEKARKRNLAGVRSRGIKR